MKSTHAKKNLCCHCPKSRTLCRRRRSQLAHFLENSIAANSKAFPGSRALGLLLYGTAFDYGNAAASNKATLCYKAKNGPPLLLAPKKLGEQIQANFS